MRIIPNCCLLLSPGARFVALFVAGSCFLNGACCRYAPRSLSRHFSLSLLKVPYTNLYFYFLSASLLVRKRETTYRMVGGPCRSHLYTGQKSKSNDRADGPTYVLGMH